MECFYCVILLDYWYSKFNDYVDVIYPEELVIKNTTCAPKRANYIYIRLEFDEDGILYTL